LNEFDKKGVIKKFKTSLLGQILWSTEHVGCQNELNHKNWNCKKKNRVIFIVWFHIKNRVIFNLLFIFNCAIDNKKLSKSEK
jgi:hypothetical protein